MCLLSPGIFRQQSRAQDKPVSGKVRNFARIWASICVFGGAACVAQAQTTLTLAWNQSAGSVAGYYIYQGTNSHLYNVRTDAGKVLQRQLSALIPGATYYFAVCTYNSAGVESDFSAEVAYTNSSSLLPPPPPVNLTPGITLAADSGIIIAPFLVTAGMVSQVIQTDATTGGRAAYTFTNLFAGNYVVSAQVKALSTNANSFYVNMDAEPTDPMMIWNLAVSSGLTNETVSWQGISDSVPKVFFLSAGTHQLIVRGREANTQLGTISITPAPFQLRVLTNKQAVLSGVAQINYAYDVLATTNLKTWSVIGTVTTDPAGSFSFTDAAAATMPARHYRLRGSRPVNPTPGATIGADSASVAAPFTLSNGMISQPLLTTVTTGGRAAYTFNNAFPGNYVVSAQVKAPNSSANSFYVNMDAEPTDPMMIWNLAVSSGLTNETVSWQGVSDSVPKVFFVSAGTHQLIVRGREANAQLGSMTIAPAPFQLRVLANKQVVLSGVAQINHAYDIMATTDLKTWSVIGTATTDATGSFSFTDAAAATIAARHYRLRG